MNKLNKFLSGLVMVLMVVVVSVLLFHSPIHAQTLSQVQQPCRVSGHTNTPACVVVIKTFSGNANSLQATFDVSPAKSLMGRVKTFSIIYGYKLRPGGYSDDLALMLSRGDDYMVSDVYSNRMTRVWITTKDGGKTWSRMTTDDMNSVLVN